MGTKEDESSTRRIWAAGFHRVTALSDARFGTFVPFICLTLNQLMCTAAIQERVTAVLRSIPKEAFAGSFQ
jgi:Ser/Thr protein kinase RdoA (MazF antagonist)